ncbi:MAG: hypothetical protein H6626_04385 [Pseudobdellovibrionaceae bacterium]|nr:hypothetical protein [Bdellovibrionales bacterium]USN48333.1 MAG: hypothetical protein H6626_04385 [Pseudobdellovibrionaceae bacterium]
MRKLHLLFIFLTSVMVTWTTGCQLADNRINGQFKDNSTTPPLPPSPPAITPDNYAGSDPTFFGHGTESDPYVLVTAAQLDALGADNSLWDKFFVLGRDIDLGDLGASTFHRIGNDTTAFTGQLNGQDFSIKNYVLTIDGTDNVGLFGKTSGATLQNIHIEDFTIDAGGGNVVGALVGLADTGSSLIRIQLSGVHITGSGDDYGGMVGIIDGNVFNSQIDSTSSVTSTGDRIGGLVGYGKPTCGKFFYVSEGVSYATVSGGDGVGGLIGRAGYYCASSGYDYHVTLSAAHGPVTATSTAGGLVGNSNDALIANSHATGDVTSSGANVGGLLGYGQRPWVGTTVYASWATGNVSGTVQVGGLVGYADGYIRYSYSTGDVEGDEYVGGVIGHSSLDGLIYVYALGTVTNHVNRAGGIAGYVANATIRDSFFAGQTNFTGAEQGGIAGGHFSSGVIERTFWDKELSGITNMCGFATASCINTFGKTTSEMKTSTTFSGPYPNEWAFASVVGDNQAFWRIDASEYPRFAWVDFNPFAGGSGTTNDPYLIATADQFNSVGTNILFNGMNFRITADIDFTLLSEPYLPWEGFNGSVDGQNHILSHLTHVTIGNNALIGSSSTYVRNKPMFVKDLNVENFNLSGATGGSHAGAVFGQNGGGPVRLFNVHLRNSSIAGGNYVGGLCGSCITVMDSSVENTSISGSNIVGGAAGHSAEIHRVTVDSTSTVTGSFAAVGGILGQNGFLNQNYNFLEKAGVHQSRAEADVSGDSQVGGLVGSLASFATIIASASSATGSVTATTSTAGGLVGVARGPIENCFATGNVSSPNKAGGLIGDLNAALTLTNTYSLGVVTGAGSKGGLIGAESGQTATYSSNYWNNEDNPSLNDRSEGDLGNTAQIAKKAKAELKQQSTFVNWNFIDIWSINETVSYPELR